MKKLALLCGWLVSISTALAALQTPVDFHFAYNGSNAVQVAWNAYPGKSYVLQTTTNLTGAWSNSATLTTSSNSFVFDFPIAATAQFFKVVKLDTEGPDIIQTLPAAGAIAVSRQSVVKVGLSDVTGINTNSIILTIGTNAPVSFPNSQLAFAGGLLTYTPATNVFHGTNGQTVTATISVTDTLGNVTTNFTWSFQLELPAVPAANIIVIGAPGGFVLVSTNGDYFTFSYPGAFPGLTNGQHLVDTNIYTGYTRTVVAFTNYPASNSVVVLTRQTKLAELLESGTFSGLNAIELTGASAKPDKDAPRQKNAFGPLVAGIYFDKHYDLQRVLTQTPGLTVQILSNSYLNWSGTLEISGNFQGRKLTQFEGKIGGNLDFRAEARAVAQGAVNFELSTNIFTSPPKRFFAVIPAGGVPIPVWFDAIFELDVGCSNHLEGALDYTFGAQGAKDFLYGSRWDVTNGWSTYSQNPPLEFAYLGPKWSVAGSGSMHVWFQPKVRLLVYSALGMAYSLQPYDDLVGRYQSNPYEYELALYSGMTGKMAVDLAVFEDYLPSLPSYPFEVIPRTLLWKTDNLGQPPLITGQPLEQWVTAGQTASFTVAANGPGPLTYRWQRYGMNLTDDSRISGTRSSTLQISRCSTNDVGSYRVIVGNPNGSVTSQNALLTVSPTNIQSGMALIPAGSFTMGDSFTEDNTYERPLHSVYVSTFYIDKYEVTKALWDSVYNWATNHGYSFEYGAQGKASTHPAHTMTWYDAVKWCNARSEKEGRTPAYYTDAGLSVWYRSGQVAPYVNWGANGYRLPTEAEWEKAARGGASGQRFPWGNTITHSQANYNGYPASSFGGFAYDFALIGYHPTFDDAPYPYSSPVGYFAPNGYGLYDMAGNVREWCWDWYGSYGSASQTDPRGPTSGSNRVLRGGDWRTQASTCRAASRDAYVPVAIDGNIGFRCARVAGQ